MSEIDLSEMDEETFDCARVERVAEDEFTSICEEFPVFFFGQLINDPDNSLFQDEDELLDESKTYCKCPNCQNLFTIGGKCDLYSEEPKSGDNFTCPRCGAEGVLAEYRDRNYPLSEMNEQDYA